VSNSPAVHHDTLGKSGQIKINHLLTVLYMYILIFQKSYTYISQSIQHNINTTHDDRWSEDIFQLLMFEEKKENLQHTKFQTKIRSQKFDLFRHWTRDSQRANLLWYTLTYRFEILTLITRIPKFVLGTESFSYPESCPTSFFHHTFSNYHGGLIVGHSIGSEDQI
jgi:hypothetical protein